MWDYQTASHFNYLELREFARQNRFNMTEGESLLWARLRGRKVAGKRFMRQHIIGKYIVDFVCEDNGLIIEVDGGYHSEPQQEESDQLRTQFFESIGFHVIRFSNEEVLNEMNTVIERIEKEFE